MYKKYAGILLMISITLGFVFICTDKKGFQGNLGQYEVVANCILNNLSEKTSAMECNHIIITGNQPHLQMQSVEREGIVLCEDDRKILYKIVQAEAGGEDRVGKILVANVILNRLEDEHFPDTIKEVVFQQKDGVAQFSPIANGKYEKAVPDEDTIEAVDAALLGEDYSEGALYFMARKYADPENVKWFDSSLDQVFVHGGHEFYK